MTQSDAPVAVVTGAAQGIGRAIALRLSRAGHRVAAYDVDEQGLETLASQVWLTGLLDVRDPAQWRSRLDELAEQTSGRLDLLVNNAGILSSGPFAEIPLEDQRRIVEVNVTGVLTGCHAAYPLLRDTPRSMVVNLASASAIYGQAELATYSATKFAVRGLTEALDLEWADDDIRVTAVWPLFVATHMVDGMDIASTRSLGVHLSADDVATTVLHLVSDRPRGVHHAVGTQAKALLAASAVTPSWMMRWVNSRIAKD